MLDLPGATYRTAISERSTPVMWGGNTRMEQEDGESTSEPIDVNE